MNTNNENIVPIQNRSYIPPPQNKKQNNSDIPPDIRPTQIPIEPHSLDFTAIPRGEAAYNHLIKNLDVDEVNKKIESLDRKEEKVTALCKHFNARSFYNPCFTMKPDGFPYYGLYAVKTGKLTMEQFSTLMIQWTLLKFQNDVTVCNLFTPDGEVNPIAREYIQQTMKAPPSRTLFMRQSAYMNDEQIDAFFAKMKTLPESERQIFIFADKQKGPTGSMAEDITDLLSGQLSISHAIQAHRSFNVFSRFTANNNRMRMYPTAGMMRAAVETVFPETCVRIIPQIGLGSLEDIERDGKTHTRTLSVQFPGVIIQEADLLPTFNTDFMWHDFAHIWMASMIPDNHQKALVKAGEIAKSLIQKMPTEHQMVAQEFYERLIDMDNKVYLLEIGETKNESIDFVLALLMSFEDMRERLVIKKTREDLGGKEYDKREVLHQIQANTSWSHKIESRTHLFKAFAEEIYKHRQEFMQLGIDIKRGLFAEYDKERTKYVDTFISKEALKEFQAAFTTTS